MPLACCPTVHGRHRPSAVDRAEYVPKISGRGSPLLATDTRDQRGPNRRLLQPLHVQPVVVAQAPIVVIATLGNATDGKKIMRFEFLPPLGPGVMRQAVALAPSLSTYLGVVLPPSNSLSASRTAMAVGDSSSSQPSDQNSIGRET